VAASVTTVSNQVSDVLGDGLVVIEEHYEYGSATSLVLVSGAVTGQTNALSARVVADDASQPRGLVEFSAVSKDSGVRFDLGSAEVGQSGLATVYRALPAGRYRVDAVFTPADGSTIAGSRLSTDDLDGDYIVRQAAVDVVVDQMADEVFAGGRVQLGARVVPEELAGGIPTGLVKFYVDGESAGDPVPLNAGRAVGWARLPAGTHQIGATFFGDSNFLAADAPAIVWDVPKAASSTSLVLTGLPGSASEPFVFDVVVSAPAGVLLSPSGHVELFDSSANTVVAVDALDSQGRAVLPVRLAAGSHRLIARYAGNDWLSGSSSAVLPVSASGQLVTVGVEASSAPSRFGERVVFTATVRPVEVFGGPPVGGRVQFVVDSVMWGAPVDVSDGVAALAVDGLSGGDHTVSASYLGDSVYQAGVSSKLTHRVIAQSAPVTLTVSQMRDKLTGSFDVLVIAQAVTGSGHNVAGKRIEVLINGRRVRTLTTDANGSASLTVRSKLLRMGNNPLVFRYYPDSSGLLPVVAKTVALRVKQIKAASLKIKASVERGTGKAVFTIKAEPAFRGFRVFKRQVHVRVNGRVVGRVLTDAKGVAVFNVPAQALRVGTNPVIIQFDPGATRYAKPISKTWKVQAARFGWVTHIKAPK
jgi:hypothetical protein